ncbi:glycogen synthase GlgA, partial [Myxococcota bacterium]|nr:glycogen synthase GlgA [Myxococcota bacterium]
MGQPLRILFAASECAPLAKAGGLGDVVGALPKALAKEGHDVRILIPRYGFLPTYQADRHLAPFAVPLGKGEAWSALFEMPLPGSNVPLYMLEHDALFGRSYIYDPPGSYAPDNAARFAFLSRGVFQIARLLDWTPDIIHVHDWPTAAVPIMLNTIERRPPFLGTATVLTIHNIAHQPRFPRSDLDLFQLGDDVFRPDGLEDFGQVNVFKGGLYHSTMLTTVSPTYAQEIRTPSGGAGLDHVIRFRGHDLVGVLNGIDEDVWNPATDPMIAAHFDAKDLSGKAACKRALQRELKLDERPDVPLIGVVSRWNAQKGIDVIIEALEEILAMDTQVVMLGAGDTAMEDYLRRRSHFGVDRFRAWVGHNERLAHEIEAGSDLFLMPSRFEPCGLNQMYSQRYGTLPIVRATGGLDDTVEQLDVARGTGTGFKFWELSRRTLADTVRWAVTVYRDHPEVFRATQARAMSKSFGWELAARAYDNVYRWALERRRGARLHVAEPLARASS